MTPEQAAELMQAVQRCEGGLFAIFVLVVTIMVLLVWLMYGLWFCGTRNK